MKPFRSMGWEPQTWCVLQRRLTRARCVQQRQLPRASCARRPGAFRGQVRPASIWFHRGPVSVPNALRKPFRSAGGPFPYKTDVPIRRYLGRPPSIISEDAASYCRRRLELNALHKPARSAEEVPASLYGKEKASQTRYSPTRSAASKYRDIQYSG